MAERGVGDGVGGGSFVGAGWVWCGRARGGAASADDGRARGGRCGQGQEAGRAAPGEGSGGGRRADEAGVRSGWCGRVGRGRAAKKEEAREAQDARVSPERAQSRTRGRTAR